MDMAFAQYMALTVCFCIGMAPVMITYLSADSTPRKWFWTALWATFWAFPPMLKMYMFALS